MAGLVRRWDEPKSRFGDLVVVGFLLMQCLDAVFTYVGVTIWGPVIEANPLISSAMGAIGVFAGLGAAKAVAIGFGCVLHLHRVHNLVALLTAIYFTVAILPWAALHWAACARILSTIYPMSSPRSGSRGCTAASAFSTASRAIRAHSTTARLSTFPR